MENGTLPDGKIKEMGRRLRECRKLRKLSQQDLIYLVEALPENNGKVRSAKQIGYIESGSRRLSADYAMLLAKALNVDSKYLLLQSPFKSKNEELNDIREKLLVGGYSGMEDEAKLSLCIKTLAECLGYEITGEHMVFDTEVGWFGGEEGDPLRVVSPDGGAVEITHREVKRMVYNIVDYARNELSKQFDPQWQSLR